MHSRIAELNQQLHAEYGLTPVMAAEIECYVMLPDDMLGGIDVFWAPVEKAFRHEGIPILRIEKERGHHQYEIVTGVMTPSRLADSIYLIRSIIEKYATRMNVPFTFAAKPYSDQPSSGLHVHLHLADDNGINSYHKTDEWTSDTLRYSLGGLLASMSQNMQIFFPTDDDYARLDDIDHVPKIFGWGVNNRYCALRIPSNPDQFDKRIEHRVACPNADPYLVVDALLNGVLRGLREQIEPSPQQYGKHGEPMILQLTATAA